MSVTWLHQSHRRYPLVNGDRSKLMCNTFQALEMYSTAHGNSKRFLPTFIQKLDTLLQGGIPAGCITEASDDTMALLITYIY